jgi:hypothetical protein
VSAWRSSLIEAKGMGRQGDGEAKGMGRGRLDWGICGRVTWTGDIILKCKQKILIKNGSFSKFFSNLKRKRYFSFFSTP